MPGVPVRGPDPRRRVRRRAGDAAEARRALVRSFCKRKRRKKKHSSGTLGIPRRRRPSARAGRSPDVPGGRRREQSADVVGGVRARMRRGCTGNRGMRRGARRERTSRKPSRKRFSKTEHTRTNPQRARVTPRDGRASPRMDTSVGPAGDARRAGARGADAAVRVPQRERRARLCSATTRAEKSSSPRARRSRWTHTTTRCGAWRSTTPARGSPPRRGTARSSSGRCWRAARARAHETARLDVCEACAWTATRDKEPGGVVLEPTGARRGPGRRHGARLPRDCRCRRGRGAAGAAAVLVGFALAYVRRGRRRGSV